jgi:hypothetical protein
VDVSVVARAAASLVSAVRPPHGALSPCLVGVDLGPLTNARLGAGIGG